MYNIIADFDLRFQDFAILEPVATFMCFPFGVEVDVDEIATKIASLFHMETSAVESEILTLQSDLQIKSRASGEHFWNLIVEEKYPNMRKIAMYLTAFFGSTYLCESAFSDMKIIKSKYRSTLTDDHLDTCLRLAISSYNPDYAKLADTMQCKSSNQ